LQKPCWVKYIMGMEHGKMKYWKEKTSPWIEAVRPKTLPLALSCTVLASFIAVADGSFDPWILVLASLTTIFLQILSNLANDYGDFKKGSDGPDRLGPRRMVATGKILPHQMKRAIAVTVVLAFASGSALILRGIESRNIALIALFFVLGSASIVAAIKYTVGKRPYGYHGLGDIMVFIFFGLIGVMGTYYLHSQHFKATLLLPASSIGLLSAGVLNLNNLRDYQSDKKSSKYTLVVMMGNKKAKIYHILLIAFAFTTTSIYAAIHFNSAYQFLFLLAMPLFINDIKTVLQNTQPLELNNELKKLALSTLFFSFSFGICCILNF
jgi:1,4-dihydroxy-2-naphthoate polyprenyltransferase